jgi:hypothetical protein
MPAILPAEGLRTAVTTSVGERHPRPERGQLSRPSLEEVRAYRAHVDERMQALFLTAAGRERAALIELGLNHEQQHQELILTDVKHLFSLSGRRVFS